MKHHHSYISALAVGFCVIVAGELIGSKAHASPGKPLRGLSEGELVVTCRVVRPVPPLVYVTYKATSVAVGETEEVQKETQEQKTVEYYY